MRTLYFDCFAGASGDMILGALVAAGISPKVLREQLSLLRLDGVEIEFESVDRSGIAATHARIRAPHEHKHRHLSEILKILSNSGLSQPVKQRAAAVFERLAEAEGRVHNIEKERVHFHEVGALDAIIDVTGAAVGFELMGIEHFVCSPLHVGSGMVEMDHGRFPVPPPAVAELLKGLPVYASDVQGELVTPTGAAIITTVCSDYGPLPKMQLEQTGYGAGTRQYDKFPNVLRLMVGEELSTEPAEETLWILETNLDDMPAQYFGHVMERAFELEALDCYFTPVQMKKNRPGVLLSILCRAPQREKLMNMLFAETTTLGVRSYEVKRRALDRSVVRVETVYGPIDVKVGRLNGKVVTETPEFEQCRTAARNSKVSLRTIEEAARSAFARSAK